jgi:hypothetical protein
MNDWQREVFLWFLWLAFATIAFYFLALWVVAATSPTVAW